MKCHDMYNMNITILLYDKDIYNDDPTNKESILHKQFTNSIISGNLNI